MSNIPIIDLQNFGDNEDEANKIAIRIKHAYTEFGFSILVNHGASEQIISEAFVMAERFHALPLEEKLKIKQNDSFRGYMPINKSQMKLSTLGETIKPNQLESFIMAFEPESNISAYKEGKYLYGDNQFPAAMPELKNTMFRYRDAMLELANKVLQCFSISFGQNSDYLSQYFNPPTFFLRLQKYPPSLGVEDQYGIAPHTDYGFFTFVAQHKDSGLEIQDKNGDWIEVPVIHNALVLNTGDMCRRISNDTFKSTPHRVINKENHNRYSIPFFFEPNMFAQIKTIDGLGNTSSKHPPVMYGDYLMERINANYGLGKK